MSPASRRPRAGGKISSGPAVPAAEFERAWVVMVSVVETALAPGVTLAGENDAVQFLGRVPLTKDTAASKDPNCGVNPIVNVADWPALTVRVAGEGFKPKVETGRTIAEDVPPPGGGL
jgi:hypothetical protein